MADEPVTDCRAFRWIGQPWTSCDNCGRPWRQHDGLHALREGAPPFGSEDDWHIKPWSELGGPFAAAIGVDPDTGQPTADERAEQMADEWRWGYIHGYLHGWNDKAAGRGYGWNRNLRKPVNDG